jgi:hypothetical protein
VGTALRRVRVASVAAEIPYRSLVEVRVGAKMRVVLRGLIVTIVVIVLICVLIGALGLIVIKVP